MTVKKFLVKLFAKSFERRRLFKKRRHPETFVCCFQTVPRQDTAFMKKGGVLKRFSGRGDQPFSASTASRMRAE
ncbi:hypothetical protein NJLHNGOC_08745 [Novacetimonas cocois]|uniref:Uncharacterized protein n=1 Tax=Novacetimonas cocois TaxID=1747507 RepID=A0A365YV96_9PROT|nr:hypothetical protein NJLHNGOC_08745 [Novacetimonas cocois]